MPSPTLPTARGGPASTRAPQPPPPRRRGRCAAAPARAAAAASSPAPLPPPRGPRAAKAAADGSWSTLEQLQYERGYCSLGPAEQYSPASVRAAVLARPNGAARLVGRALTIVGRLTALAASVAVERVLGNGDEDGATVRARAARLRQTLVDLGPSFIKAGQVLASRPDIVREDYMNELCTLQDDVPPFPDDEAFAILEAELGRPLASLFSSISDGPIAAASLGQVYRAVLRETGEEVAVKVQRPGARDAIMADLVLLRLAAAVVNPLAMRRLGCNAELIVDEFGEKLLEELDYAQEARNAADFGRNFAGDPTVKIPWVRPDLTARRVLVMEWIDGMRCTDPASILASGIDVDEFIRCGVVSGLRQLLEFGLFHGDPHPGNIFCLPDGRIAYVDFGNVAELSQRNKQTLVDAVVHAVNEDYASMAGDFIKLGFLAPGTDIAPIVPALESIWADSLGRSLADFNFRTVTSKFNELVYQHPIRIPERYALVIRSLLTQEGICLRLRPAFHFLEVAYPYIARRLLTDDDPALRERLIQVLLQDGQFQWARLENLVALARSGGAGEGEAGGAAAPAAASPSSAASRLDLSDTVASAARLVATDGALRAQLLDALTEGDTLHVEEAARVAALLAADVDVGRVARDALGALPALGRQLAVAWADGVLSR